MLADLDNVAGKWQRSTSCMVWVFDLLNVQFIPTPPAWAKYEKILNSQQSIYRPTERNLSPTKTTPHSQITKSIGRAASVCAPNDLPFRTGASACTLVPVHFPSPFNCISQQLLQNCMTACAIRCPHRASPARGWESCWPQY